MNEEKRIKIMQMITVAAVLLFVLLTVALIVNLVRLASVNSRKARLEAELNRLDAQIAANNDTIDYRQTEAYVDAYAREYLNMIGSDEEAFTGK